MLLIQSIFGLTLIIALCYFFSESRRNVRFQLVAKSLLLQIIIALLLLKLPASQQLFAVMAPLTMMMGIPWQEAFVTGQLMGTKTVLTEFVAYVKFGQIPADELTERTRIIMTYALCGFANFVSLGIMVTGLVTMVPERRKEIMDMGGKSIVAGTIATCTSATLVGIIVTL